LAIVYHAQADTNYSFEVSGSGQSSFINPTWA
jgi:hypothetical protein